ncbi:lipopolysaccharide biosynthesis protein [Arcicella lustrica]|uniref:Oligosaccharide flippase family protein n=1 Tax=Arcicella lustrica TaxID=2984196 RepID=A0ABU5SMX9_9BACT|nr:oligosaccharide flippase family protein [Arcicella sp. DC25W]MEA5428594.1 oligosaccharide flippase family protein [Arcicella sp. DC25W]
MSKSKNIFGGFFWSLLGNILNAIYGFFSVPILLVYFGKTDYGIIGLAMSINIYLRLMDMGLASGNVKFFSSSIVKQDNNIISKLFQSSLVLYGIIGIINVITIFIISFFVKDLFQISAFQAQTLKYLLYVVMFTSLVSWISSAFEQYIRANELVGWHQKIMIIPKLLQVLIIVITIQFNLSLILFFTLQTICSIIVFPIFVYKVRTINPSLKIRFIYFHDVFKNVLLYSLSIFSFSIFQISANYFRPIILGIKLGVDSIADYRIIEGFANLVMMLGVSFVGVILPTATKVVSAGDYEKELKIAFDGTKFITIFLCLIVTGFILVSNELLDIYVGSKYSYLCIWLNLWVFSLLGSHNSALSSLVLASDNLKPIVYISGFSTIFSLCLAWFFVPYIGLGAVIISYLVYVILQLSFYYVYYYRKVMGYDSKKLFLKSFFIPALKIFSIFLLIYTLKSFFQVSNSYVTIVFWEIIYVVMVFPVIYYFVINVDERSFLLNLIINKKKNERD